MNSRILRGTAGLVMMFASVFVGGACGSESESQDGKVPTVQVGGEKNEEAPTVGPDGQQVLGEYRGHWDGRRLTITPVRELVAGIRPRGFIQIPDAYMEFSTDEAIVVNNQGSQCQA